MGKAVQAADELAAAFFRAVPPNRKKRMSEQEWTNSLETFHVEAQQIRKRLSLGVIARARCAYLLQQRLLQDGFPPDLVRKLVFTLVLNAFSGKG